MRVKITAMGSQKGWQTEGGVRTNGNWQICHNIKAPRGLMKVYGTRIQDRLFMGHPSPYK